MDLNINFLILIWIVGATVGLFYSLRGMRAAWGDLLVVGPDPIALEVAASAFKRQVVQTSIELVWLGLGIIAVFTVAGPLVVWGLIFTNYALAYLSRESYVTRARVIEKIMRKNQEEKS